MAPDRATSAVRRQRHALWAALALIVVWGANFSVQKAAFAYLQPGGFLFARYLIMPLAAALLLLCATMDCAGRACRAPTCWRCGKLGIAGHLIHVGMVTYGIHWSTAFSSSLILACGPVFTLADPALVRPGDPEPRPRWQVWASAFAGVLVFLSDKLLGGQWRASGGDLFLLVAASFFSYYTVAAKPLIERHGGVVVMTYATLLGSAPVVAAQRAGRPGGRLGRACRR